MLIVSPFPAPQQPPKGSCLMSEKLVPSQSVKEVQGRDRVRGLTQMPMPALGVSLRMAFGGEAWSSIPLISAFSRLRQKAL